MSDEDLKIDLYLKVLAELTESQDNKETAKKIVALMETESAKSYLTGEDRATLADRIGRLVDAEVQKVYLAYESTDETLPLDRFEELDQLINEKELEADRMRVQLFAFMKELRRES